MIYIIEIMVGHCVIIRDVNYAQILCPCGFPPLPISCSSHWTEMDLCYYYKGYTYTQKHTHTHIYSGRGLYILSFDD